MPLPKDPDTLRVPAFMRRRSLRAGARRPLLLTALDRKQAGVLPEALQQALQFAKPKKAPSVRRVRKTLAQDRPTTVRRKIVRPKITKQKKETSFSAPLLDSYAEMLVENRKIAAPREKTAQSSIGELTYYYDKIKVGVIKLTGTLTVGDCIRYELAEPTDEEDTYEEIIESMEIDRSPVFKAGRGKEVGIKLRKKPRVGSAVVIT